MRYLEFELTAEGVVSVRLGMTREQARVALESLGEVLPFKRGARLREGDVGDWRVWRDGLMVFAYCDDAGCVDAIELSSPGHGVAGADRVTFGGIDLFIDPADTVIDALRRQGHQVNKTDNGYTSILPAVLLALWRDGEPFDEVAGLPRYFEAAMVARPGYRD